MSHTLVFLGFVISSKDMEVDLDKVKAVRNGQFPLLCMKFVAFRFGHILSAFYS